MIDYRFLKKILYGSAFVRRSGTGDFGVYKIRLSDILSFLSLSFAGKLNTKLTEADHIHIGKHYGSMSLASTEIRDLFQGKACGIAGCSTHGKCDQDLINVKTWIFASKIFGLQLLDRMDGIREITWRS